MASDNEKQVNHSIHGVWYGESIESQGGMLVLRENLCFLTGGVSDMNFKRMAN